MNWEPSSKQAFAIVLVVGIAGTGMLDFALSQAGLSNLAGVVWALGYGTTVFLLWFGWVRHLDFSEAGEPADVWSDPDDEESAEAASE